MMLLDLRIRRGGAGNYFEKEILMVRTDMFRTQHEGIMEVAGQILSGLNPDELSRDASDLRSKLSKLLGKLQVHLAMEDKTLYPQLLQHENTMIKMTAKKYFDEMGGISNALKGYMSKWASPRLIQANPHEFIVETKAIFSTLSKRIEQENNELYPMVDKLG